MKIAVLAEQPLKEEMQQKSAGTDADFIWVNSIEELMRIKDVDAYFDLEFMNDLKRIYELKKLFPKPVFINSVVHTLSKINQPFIRINAWNGFLKRPVCEIAAHVEEQKNLAKETFQQLNWQYRFVPDMPGMVSARIIAAIINEAYYTLQDEVSTKAEIDMAMKLGTNYPYGPFEWSEKIGLKNIYDLLAELYKIDDRYKISEMMENEVKADS